MLVLEQHILESATKGNRQPAVKQLVAPALSYSRNLSTRMIIGQTEEKVKGNLMARKPKKILDLVDAYLV